jgi:hypothetical protein
MKVESKYSSLKSLIDHLKVKKEVIGIVEYGGRSFNDMSIGGDYDLTVILEKSISSNFNGVHFHILDIPVDCMILSIDDFLDDSPQNPFYLVHLDCNILYDKDNRTKELLQHIREKWMPSNEISKFEEHLFRFTFQHILDKLKNRLHDDPLFTRFFIYSSFDWYIECYARIQNLKVGQPKAHLNHIKENNMELYQLATKLYLVTDIDEQFKILKECAIQIMEPIGGLWKKNEILLHLLPDGQVLSHEESEVMNLLFG